MKLLSRLKKTGAVSGLRPISEADREVIDLSKPVSAAGIQCNTPLGPNSELVRDSRYASDGKVIIRSNGNQSDVSIRIGRIKGTLEVLVAGSSVSVDVGYCGNFTVHMNLGEKSEVEIGDDCTIGGLRVWCRMSGLTIGNDCMISSNIVINSAQHHGVVDLSGDTPALIERRPSIEVGDHVWLGQHSAILSNAKIGNGSILGAFSVTAGKLPANVIAAGNPAEVKSRNRTWSRLVKRFDPGTQQYLEGLGA